MKAVCKVCDILDNDKKEKKGEYCSFCKAFICSKCEYDYFRRGMAMIKMKYDKSK